MTHWGVVIQARMGSTRLPGKVLADILGAPALVRQIERIWRIPGLKTVVVATSDLPQDDPVAELVNSLPAVGLFRGSEHDVLGRYAGAAAAFDLDAVIRLTADCPLIDPDVVGAVVTAFLHTDGCDYASNCRPRTYPHGFDCEMVSRRALDAAAAEAVDPFQREHVLPFVFSQPDRFRCINVEAPDARHVGLRLTMDYPEDLDLVRAVYAALYPSLPDFRSADILALLEQRPDIVALNRSHSV
ncbi:cytidylyltransferase domain-containing protein [Insolitispirillum peregrinum]|uniref:cytidylyltransferase domain-containing protein n=1 Tax=Insolitispirillum peregrinum TaxID=80876 RepID=UPI00360B49ED